MREYVELGVAPCDEDCVQVGEEDYLNKARKECRKYISLIRECCGSEPDGAQLKIKSFEHDFGNYYEVVCSYDDKFPDSVDYAFRIEGTLPRTWNG